MADYYQLGRQQVRLRYLGRRRSDEFMMALPQESGEGGCGCDVCAKKSKKKKKKPLEVQVVEDA